MDAIWEAILQDLEKFWEGLADGWGSWGLEFGKKQALESLEHAVLPAFGGGRRILRAAPLPPAPPHEAPAGVPGGT